MGINIQKSKALLNKLYASGVRDFVVCPGGRNAPIVEVLEKCTSTDIQVYWGFEERSASFMALGLSTKFHSPVAVFTTSGTAFVETTSAMLEAHYSGLPLIVVSADRPESQWGTGAPQTMIQKDFLKTHLGESVDDSYDPQGVSYPLHINCCFEEPLIDGPIDSWIFESPKAHLKVNFKDLKNPYRFKFENYSLKTASSLTGIDFKSQSALKVLFLISGLSLSNKSEIAELIKPISADIYFEATGEIFDHSSQMSSRDIDRVNVIENYDLVVRVGGIPTHRVWRDFELKKFKNILHFSDIPLPGVSDGAVFKLSEFKNFMKDLSKNQWPSVLELNLKTKLQNMDLNQNINLEKNSNFSEEQKFFTVIKDVCSQTHFTKGQTNAQPVFYIGNSLPIRHWDIDKSIKFNEVYANRGLNGIDGQLSSALGISIKSKGQKTIVVLGDLTTMYDLAAPWYWLKYKSQINLSLIVVNNGGGQIFSKMFSGPSFLNKHQIEFQSWAEMWGLSYLKVTSSEDFKNKLQSLDVWPDIIEYKAP